VIRRPAARSEEGRHPQHAAAATRDLFGNPTALPDSAAWPLTHPVASSLAWCASLLAVAVPLTLRRFRAKTIG
jgi:hypothetical protein